MIESLVEDIDAADIQYVMFLAALFGQSQPVSVRTLTKAYVALDADLAAHQQLQLELRLDRQVAGKALVQRTHGLVEVNREAFDADAVQRVLAACSDRLRVHAAPSASTNDALANKAPESDSGETGVDTDCKFCLNREKWMDQELGSVWAHADGYPVSAGHHLIIPKRHASDLFAMTTGERQDADAMIFRLREQLMANDPTIEGFNVGMNCGAQAGQSIFHAHWHLIPRRQGDSRAKKGGVRGVIPEKMEY